MSKDPRRTRRRGGEVATRISPREVGDVGGATKADMSGGTTGVVITIANEGEFTENMAVWCRR